MFAHTMSSYFQQKTNEPRFPLVTLRRWFETPLTRRLAGGAPRQPLWNRLLLFQPDDDDQRQSVYLE
jgi:hypothetical protein